MSGFEYEAIFIGIIVGLAIQNILWSFHKLVEARGRVRWHWMAPTFAIEAAVLTLGTFWYYWLGKFVTGPYMNSFLAFLSFALGMALQYLTCAATLPDEVPEVGIDLEAYYYANRYRAWGFSAAYNFINVCGWLWVLANVGTGSARLTGFVFLGLNTLALVANIALVFVRTWWVHAVWLIYGTIALLVTFGPMHLKI